MPMQLRNMFQEYPKIQFSSPVKTIRHDSNRGSSKVKVLKDNTEYDAEFDENCTEKYTQENEAFQTSFQNLEQRQL